MTYIAVLIENSIHVHRCQKNQISLSKIIFIKKILKIFDQNLPLDFLTLNTF